MNEKKILKLLLAYLGVFVVGVLFSLGVSYWLFSKQVSDLTREDFKNQSYDSYIMLRLLNSDITMDNKAYVIKEHLISNCYRVVNDFYHKTQELQESKKLLNQCLDKK